MNRNSDGTSDHSPHGPALPSPMQRAATHAARYISEVGALPVGSVAAPAALRQRLVQRLPEKGTDAATVIDELVAAAQPGLVASTGGRYHGFVIGGALPVATAADWLTATWDQNASFYLASPSSAVIEEAVGAWFADLLNLPRSASFGFTTGAQSANLIALAAARHRLLAGAGWDVNTQGLQNAPPITVLASAGRHVSIDRAVRMLGMGTNAVVPIAIDDQGAMRVDALADAATRHRSHLLIVCTQAGNVNTGAVDPFVEIADIAAEVEAWMHVDGAFGLWAAASSRRAYLVEGAHLGHSWAVDAHKWLNIPHDCGAVFVNDEAAHRAATGISASYSPGSDGRDPSAWVPEFSRRARATPAYAALRHLGRAGVEQLIDRCCDHAAVFAAGLSAMPGVEVLNEVRLNQVLWRVVDGDDATDRALAAIQSSGETWMGPTLWRDQRAIRISVSAWSTSRADVERTLSAIGRAVRQSRAAR